MNENQKQKLETSHRDLIDQLNFADPHNIEEFIKSLKIIADDIGEAIYVPDFNNLGDLPANTFSCPTCGSTNLKTVLTHEIKSSSETKGSEKGKIINTSQIYEKTCRACGQVYKIDQDGTILDEV